MSEVQVIVRRETTTIIHSGSNQSGGSTGGAVSMQIDGGVAPSLLIGKTITWTETATGNKYDNVIATAVPFFLGTIVITYVNATPAVTIPPTSGSFTFVITDEQSQAYYLDLWPDETISQNWKFTDISKFQSVGGFSREFRLPASNTNITAIGAMYDANYNSANNYFHQKLPAEILVDSMPIANGYIRVIKTYKQAGILHEYEVSFYSESPDLFRSLVNKKLADISALGALNHVLDYDSVAYDSDLPYIYALTDYGQKWSEAGEANTRSLFSSNVSIVPKAGDLTPCVKWSFLFRNIIEEAGFVLDASELEAKLEQYYMPFLTKSTIQYEESDQGILFKLGLTNPYTFTQTSFEVDEITLTAVTEYFDNGNNVSGGLFTTPVTGKYKFRFWFTALNGTVPWYTIRIRRTSDNAVLYSMNITGVTGSILTHYDNASEPIEIEIESGVEIVATIQAYGGTELFNNSLGYNAGTGFELIGVTVLDGGTISYPLNAPNFSQTQFVQDVLNMHCCAIVPDRLVPNKIRIVPMNNYLAEGEEDNWTRKLHVDSDIVLYSTADEQSSKLRFTYSAGQDVASKFFSEAANRTYGDYYVIGYTASENDLPNAFANDGEMRIQLTTESTPAQYVKGTGIVIPKFINQNGDFVSPNMRCLYLADFATIRLYNYSTSTIDTAFEVPLINHYNTLEPTVSDFDLNFAPETPLHIIPANPVNNLFNLYWRDYINNTYSPEARILEASFMLDLTDILKFRFNDKIWVYDSWWRILEIKDYKIGQYLPTKVKLMKIVDQQETSVVPVGVEDDGGLVAFQTRSGSPASGTEAACTRYGYFWDSATNSCRAIGTINEGRRYASADRRIGRSLNEIQNGDDTLAITDQLNNDASNQYSAFVGRSITVPANNNYVLAVGDTLQKIGQSPDTTMLGRNALVNHSGIHYGGGWLKDELDQPEGQIQFGHIVLGNSTGFNTTGDNILLFLNGQVDKHIQLPDNTIWLVHVRLLATTPDASITTQVYWSEQLTRIDDTLDTKYGTQIDENNNGLQLDISWDISDNVNHKLIVTGTLGSPVEDVTLMAYVAYQQIRVTPKA